MSEVEQCRMTTARGERCDRLVVVPPWRTVILCGQHYSQLEAQFARDRDRSRRSLYPPPRYDAVYWDAMRTK